MTDDLVDHLNAPEIFFDGIHEIKVIEGVVRAALYTRQDAHKVVVVRLAIPVSALPEVIQAMMASLVDATVAVMPPNVSNNTH